LSQDRVTVLQQFDDQEKVTEQQVYMPRYPLHGYLPLHFVDADFADRAQNTELEKTIGEVPDSDAMMGATEEMRLQGVRAYLQRRPRRTSPSSTDPPLFPGNADFAISNLHVMIPTL
jgi:hypothetical protein